MDHESDSSGVSLALIKVYGTATAEDLKTYAFYSSKIPRTVRLDFLQEVTRELLEEKRKRCGEEGLLCRSQVPLKTILSRIGKRLYRVAQKRRLEIALLADPPARNELARAEAATHQLENLLDLLDDEQKPVFQLRTLGKPLRAIAEQLGISISAANRRLNRIYAKLRASTRDADSNP